jgi:hypothetical protein
MRVEEGEDERRRRKREQSSTITQGGLMSFKDNVKDHSNVQGSRVPELAAALRGIKLLNVRH